MIAKNETEKEGYLTKRMIFKRVGMMTTKGRLLTKKDRKVLTVTIINRGRGELINIEGRVAKKEIINQDGLPKKENY